MSDEHLSAARSIGDFPTKSFERAFFIVSADQKKHPAGTCEARARRSVSSREILPGLLTSRPRRERTHDATMGKGRGPEDSDDDAAFVAFDWPPADGSRAAPLEPTVGQHDRGSSASADESARSLPSESRIGRSDS